MYPWRPKTPWKPEYWKLRPDTEAPTDALDLPNERGNGWPIDSGMGLETIVLLARDKPLPATVPLDRLLSGLPAQQIQQTETFVWLERGERYDTSGASPNFSKPQMINDATLRLKNLLEERLKPHFAVFRAVCLSNRGS